MTTHRPAVLDDIDQIFAIERTCSQNPWTRDGIESGLSSGTSVFLVSENQENRVIAFACSSIVLDELHILEVAVDPAYRNRGIGAQLINQTIAAAAAKNAKRAYLEVRHSNLSAIRLYEKCGFTKEVVRTAYYGDGEDAVFMSRLI